MDLPVQIKKFAGHDDLPLPEYATAGAAGMDLRAAVTASVILEPGKMVMVSCGFSIAVPEGFEAQVRPRSGLASKFGITLSNSPGTIDSDYRGEVKVPLINLGSESFEITRGLRIAQMVVAPVNRVRWQEVEELSETARSVGGFGHTGTS
ncbi:MAG TPA: dUTP diphosphatase [Candidatus Saccharimonadales bacterium]|nr:dUTP diphosphatase [Candidatus Saccharimonadales bacterium]